MVFQSITHKIIKSGLVVNNYLGIGFSENVYKRSFAFEMNINGLKTCIEKPIDVFYKGENVGRYYADIVVDDQIILEIKCVEKIIYPHIAQLKNYLAATRYPIGMIFNFKHSHLSFIRAYP